MRALDLSVKHVQSIKAMTVSKETVIASEKSHPNLFWGFAGWLRWHLCPRAGVHLEAYLAPEFGHGIPEFELGGYNDTKAF